MKISEVKQEDFKELIDTITRENKINQSDLSEMLGYGKTYLSELISRGNITTKHVDAINRLFKNNSKKQANEIDVLKKTIEVLLVEVAKISVKGTSVAPTTRLRELKEEIALRLSAETHF